MFGLRLGLDPRVIVTTTPRATTLVRSILKDPKTHAARGSTFDNSANLAAGALEELRKKYEGTRLGRQELYAEILDDVPGALWTLDSISHVDTLPPMQRVVVGVDPSGADGDPDGGGDDIGISVCGIGEDGLFYVIEDATCALGPAGWGARVIDRFNAHLGDKIVAERNFGGAMVEAVIRQADKFAPVRLVTASRGKAVRAEPIAMLYEQGRVRHARALDQLEGQMIQMTGTGYVGERSPDRLDAMVWAMTELSEVASRRRPTALYGAYG
jgi:phage terminase large subunit-like protein